MWRWSISLEVNLLQRALFVRIAANIVPLTSGAKGYFRHFAYGIHLQATIEAREPSLSADEKLEVSLGSTRHGASDYSVLGLLARHPWSTRIGPPVDHEG